MPVEIAVAPASAGPFCAYCRKTFSSQRRCRQHTSQVHLTGSGKAALLVPPRTAQGKVRVGGVTRGPRPSTTRFRPRSARALRSTARPQLVQTLAALRTKKKLSGFTAKKLRQKRARGPRQALRRLQIMRTAIGAQRPPWISRIAEPALQKKERKREVALKRRNMAEWSRGRVKFDRLALDFGAPGTINGTSQTLHVTNIGMQTVYFGPWVRGKLCAIVISLSSIAVNQFQSQRRI
ncbi:hypothetical protein C8R43DRAFT_975789 [Mycena crocata]|nr:hypothetical protein C8R43DRAFT_975789 [Mycena crocata]